MLKANGPSIYRQQAIECRIALCSANQHQTDAVPLSRRGSASRNLLLTNLLAGELDKDAPVSPSTSRTTWVMVSNRLTHSNTSPHLGQPFFQKQLVTPRYSQIYRTNHDPFSLALASESVWNKNAQRSLTLTGAPHVASRAARRRSQESRAIKRYRIVSHFVIDRASLFAFMISGLIRCSLRGGPQWCG